MSSKIGRVKANLYWLSPRASLLAKARGPRDSPGSFLWSKPKGLSLTTAFDFGPPTTGPGAGASPTGSAFFLGKRKAPLLVEAVDRELQLLVGEDYGDKKLFDVMLDFGEFNGFGVLIPAPCFRRIEIKALTTSALVTSSPNRIT
jgi:hypothetical protein